MKKLFSLILIGFLIPSLALATVGFSGTGTMVNKTTAVSSNSFTLSATGTNRLLAVCIAWDDSAGASTVTSVTVGAGLTPLVLAGTQANSVSGILHAAWYVLAAPPTGAQTVTVTMGGTGFVENYYNAVVFNTVNQTTPVRPGTYFNTAGNYSGTSRSVVITSNVLDRTITCSNAGLNGGPTTNQTSDGNNAGGTNSGISDHATTPAATVTHTIGGGPSGGAIAISGFSIQEVTSGGSTAVSYTPRLIASALVQPSGLLIIN